MGHDVGVVGQTRQLVLGDGGLVPAVGAGDEASPVSNVQDLDETAGADPVQAVQDLGLAVEGIVALVADLTLQLLRRKAVCLGLRRAHLQVML